MKKNPFTNTRIEFHILQSFPVSCLNRDDVGSPKTALVGGSTRARVSSQCWKRQVRMEMNKLGVTSGVRTKLLGLLISEACEEAGATEEQALLCGKAIQSIFIKNDENEKKKAKNSTKKQKEEDTEDEEKTNDTLIFLSPNEVQVIVKELKEHNFDPQKLFTKTKKTKETEASSEENKAEIETDSKKRAKMIEQLILKNTKSTVNALDIALFGRMIALAANMHVEAAASFSHALSTHRVGNEVEFFSALDDKSEEPGAAHLGSLEYNAATYYRYISLDLGQLWKTLNGVDILQAVEAFTKALFIAIPSARQSTMSAASQWDFAKIFIRKGQRLQLSFETAIQAKENGFLKPSIESLTEQLSIKEKRAGSLFGKEREFTFGADDQFNIDDLVNALQDYVQKVEA